MFFIKKNHVISVIVDYIHLLWSVPYLDRHVCFRSSRLSKFNSKLQSLKTTEVNSLVIVEADNGSKSETRMSNDDVK